MRFECINTGSDGNCYVLTDSENRRLLLDVGIGIKQIKVGIGFAVNTLVGAVVTHSHI